MTADVTGLALQLLERRTPFCLATVVVAGAGTGLRPGEKLLVYGDGKTVGEIGSAELTRAVAAAASSQLAASDIRLARFSTAGDELPPRRSLRGGEPELGTVDVALEPMLPPPRLVIVGAGHIAVPLAHLAKIVGFEVVVIDDRVRFANRERFPDADEVVVDDFQRAIAAQDITPWTYLVLVTRGHEYDEATLQSVVGSPAPYIGMIGSRRRVLLVFQRLAAAGTPDEFLDRIYAPIGLDIGARTPEEIALAILAEMVNVRRGGSARSLAIRQRGV